MKSCADEGSKSPLVRVGSAWACLGSYSESVNPQNCVGSSAQGANKIIDSVELFNPNTMNPSNAFFS